MTERPAQQSSDWDPTVADPLYTAEDWDAWLEDYRRKPGVSRAVLVWAFAALVVILAILAAALLIGGTPRDSSQGELRQGLDATQDAVLGTPTVTTESYPQLGDVRAGAIGLADGERRPRSMGHVHPAAGLALPDTSTSVSGTASWFCGGGSACTRGYPPGQLVAAAGPALRVGDWRGRIVKVCSSGRCVRVALVDFCACPRRVIDLYRSAFSRLASPSRGVLRVEVTWGGRSGLTLPPTDTQEAG